MDKSVSMPFRSYDSASLTCFSLACEESRVPDIAIAGPRKTKF